MSIQIPADTTLRVETNPDGTLTLHFDRKRPHEPETTAIEETEIEDADVTAVADDAVTTFTRKRHKTAVFDEKLALAKTLVATPGQRREDGSYRAHVCRSGVRRSPGTN